MMDIATNLIMVPERMSGGWLSSVLLVLITEGERHLFCTGGNYLRRVELGRADWVSGR